MKAKYEEPTILPPDYISWREHQNLVDAQAEISFKAGIKEVVEWGLETCPHDLFGEGTQCYKRACDECWQEKWGNLAP